MEYLNKSQLAFLLDIKPNEARAKMCVAWCKRNKLRNDAYWSRKKLLGDTNYPDAMPIELLADCLNLPTLQEMVNDVCQNYLTRKASRKYILSDYPEKQLNSIIKGGSRRNVKIPAALRSMLPSKTLSEIKTEWVTRYGAEHFS